MKTAIAIDFPEEKEFSISLTTSVFRTVRNRPRCYIIDKRIKIKARDMTAAIEKAKIDYPAFEISMIAPVWQPAKPIDKPRAGNFTKPEHYPQWQRNMFRF